MTKRIFITFCAAAACCVLLGACESGSLAAAAGKRTRPADLGELQFITPAEGDPIATLSTTLGDISFVLYPDIAPMAVENFVGLAQQGYYNGLSFHRVIEGFLVQTGDATGTGAGGSTIWNGNSYPNEISDRLHHYAGAVAMAHAPDGASGNLSQFYIVQSAQDSVDKTLAKTLTEAGVREAVVTAYQAVGGAPYLDNLDTVFGQVYDGMDVVDAIAAVVVGGTSMSGGSGRLGGTLIGALIIGILNNGLNLMGINSDWQYIIKGAVILLAVYMDFLRSQKRASGR